MRLIPSNKQFRKIDILDIKATYTKFKFLPTLYLAKKEPNMFHKSVISFYRIGVLIRKFRAVGHIILFKDELIYSNVKVMCLDF